MSSKMTSINRLFYAHHWHKKCCVLEGNGYNINKVCIGINEFNAVQKGKTMELAKITKRGQITIPVEIRKKLGVQEGDKVIFLEDNGRIIIGNAALAALKLAQNAFEGEAERVGLEDEQDVVDLVKDIRREE
jgi:antitoxin PrlF